MSSATIETIAPETHLVRQPAPSGEGDPVDATAEHPLARELRAILADPTSHRIGDLARVVDQIQREMSMLARLSGTNVDPNS